MEIVSSSATTVRTQPPASLLRPNAVIVLAALLLLAAFGIATIDLQRDSLWNDEGWTAWAVGAPSLAETVARIRSDVHPPLYFLLLYGWVRAAGDSVYALRLLSACFGMIGLAATYAVGKKLVDPATGLLALVILGTASFFVYYTREARMYTLLLALGALATWLYLLWREHRTFRCALAYGLLMAALLYTHYAGALVILTHLIHLAVTYVINESPDLRRQTLKRPATEKDKPTKAAEIRVVIVTHFSHLGHLFVPYSLAFLLYLPWLPIFLNQMRANPNGPLAIPVQTDLSTVAALVLILVGGSWWLYVAPFLLGRALPKLRRYGSAVLLLVVWLLLTPAALLALNAWIAPVYQVRYAIAMLPAGALLIAYGLRWVGFPVRVGRSVIYQRLLASLPHPKSLPASEEGLANTGRSPSSFTGKGSGDGVKNAYPDTYASVIYLVPTIMALIFLYLLVQSQLTIYPELWPEKPPWDATIRAMTDARDPLDPTITDIAAYSPAGYYDRQLHIRGGVSLDLSWRLHHYDELMTLVGKFDQSGTVWVALPVNTAKSWHIVAALDRARHITYRSSLVNMIFYRFEAGDADDLEYRFDDVLRFDSAPGASERFSLSPGQELCVDLEFSTLAALDGDYSAGLHLVDITGTTVIAQWDVGLGKIPAEERLTLQPCMTVPGDAPPGYYHLELVIYEWANQRRLRVFEDGAGDPLPWGDVLILAAVDVAG